MIEENCIKALKAIHKLHNGEEAVLNIQDCEDCVSQGWMELHGRNYIVTPEGYQKLNQAEQA